MKIRAEDRSRGAALLRWAAESRVSSHGANAGAVESTDSIARPSGRLFNTSNNGLRAFSGVTVGVVGGLIGIHWSLAISAMILLAVTVALLALFIPGRSSEELG